MPANGASNLPLSERTHPWDRAGAEQRIREWADAQDTPNRRYARAFFWYDPRDTTHFQGFKLAFADVVDGELTAIWRGVVLCAAVMQGARGGVKIPDADRPGVRAHIEAYYKRFSREWGVDMLAPWLQEGNPMRSEPQQPHSLAEFEALIDGEKRAVQMTVDDVTDDPAKGYVTVTGHAAVFDQLSDDLGGFREVIRRGAFRRVLAENPDIALLYNHNWDTILARTRNGSLQVREDPKGLHITARLDPEDSDVQRILPKMRRGDLNQMSFAFRTKRDGVRREVRNGEIVRNVTDVAAVSETSIVGRPAYPQTLVRLEQRFQLSEDMKDAIVEEIRSLDHPNDEPDTTPVEDDTPTEDAVPAEDDVDTEDSTDASDAPVDEESGERADPAYWSRRITELRIKRYA